MYNIQRPYSDFDVRIMRGTVCYVNEGGGFV